jgi:hypothetical protein
MYRLLRNNGKSPYISSKELIDDVMGDPNLVKLLVQVFSMKGRTCAEVGDVGCKGCRCRRGLFSPT